MFNSTANVRTQSPERSQPLAQATNEGEAACPRVSDDAQPPLALATPPEQLETNGPLLGLGASPDPTLLRHARARTEVLACVESLRELAADCDEDYEANPR